MKISWKPRTERENQIVKQLGADDWDIVKSIEKVIVLNNEPGLLIKKSGHGRWIRKNQVILENKNV